MLEKKIDEMKQQLNEMILTEELSSKRILHYSQALDHLLVDYMKREAYIKKNTSKYHIFIEGNKKVDKSARLQQGDNLIHDLVLTTIKAG